MYDRRAVRNSADIRRLDLVHQERGCRRRGNGPRATRYLRRSGQGVLVVREVYFVIRMLVFPSRWHLHVRSINGVADSTLAAGMVENEVYLPVLVGNEHRMGIIHGCRNHRERERALPRTEEVRHNDKPDNREFSASPDHPG